MKGIENENSPMLTSKKDMNHVRRDANRSLDVIYTVDEVPTLGLCLFLGFQHCLTAINGQIILPMFLVPIICLDSDWVGLSEIIGTCMFVAGLVSVLQTTFGVRYGKKILVLNALWKCVLIHLQKV